MFLISDAYLDNLIEEDLHIVDMTVEALGIEDVPGTIDCFPKKNCVVAGVEEAARIFARVGAEVEMCRKSGSPVEAGTIVLRVRGGAGRLHAVYKLAQNVMEYSSGIATRCAAMVASARRASKSIEVLVTRKHFPGGKKLSLKAALAGGAGIHRLGLSDSILVFDQHREFIGGSDGFAKMVPVIAERLPEKKIAVEAGSPEEAIAFALAGVDIIQCERFDLTELADCVKKIRGINPNAKVTAAGGVNAENAAQYAATGVDVLVTSWPFFGKPEDIKMKFSRPDTAT